MLPAAPPHRAGCASAGRRKPPTPGPGRAAGCRSRPAPPDRRPGWFRRCWRRSAGGYRRSPAQSDRSPQGWPPPPRAQFQQERWGERSWRSGPLRGWPPPGAGAGSPAAANLRNPIAAGLPAAAHRPGGGRCRGGGGPGAGGLQGRAARPLPATAQAAAWAGRAAGPGPATTPPSGWPALRGKGGRPLLGAAQAPVAAAAGPARLALPAR